MYLATVLAAISVLTLGGASELLLNPSERQREYSSRGTVGSTSRLDGTPVWFAVQQPGFPATVHHMNINLGSSHTIVGVVVQSDTMSASGVNQFNIFTNGPGGLELEHELDAWNVVDQQATFRFTPFDAQELRIYYFQSWIEGRGGLRVGVLVFETCSYRLPWNISSGELSDFDQNQQFGAIVDGNESTIATISPFTVGKVILQSAGSGNFSGYEVVYDSSVTVNLKVTCVTTGNARTLVDSINMDVDSSNRYQTCLGRSYNCTLVEFAFQAIAVMSVSEIRVFIEDETEAPTLSPPTIAPSIAPTSSPTTTPSTLPSSYPTSLPSRYPTSLPTMRPTFLPTTLTPTSIPSTLAPTTSPNNVLSPTLSDGSESSSVGLIVGVVVIIVILIVVAVIVVLKKRSHDKYSDDRSTFDNVVDMPSQPPMMDNPAYKGNSQSQMASIRSLQNTQNNAQSSNQSQYADPLALAAMNANPDYGFPLKIDANPDYGIAGAEDNNYYSQPVKMNANPDYGVPSQMEANPDYGVPAVEENNYSQPMKVTMVANPDYGLESEYYS